MPTAEFACQSISQASAPPQPSNHISLNAFKKRKILIPVWPSSVASSGSIKRIAKSTAKSKNTLLAGYF
jgi:hypothetical protein